MQSNKHTYQTYGLYQNKIFLIPPNKTQRNHKHESNNDSLYTVYNK